MFQYIYAAITIALALTSLAVGIFSSNKTERAVAALGGAISLLAFLFLLIAFGQSLPALW